MYKNKICGVYLITNNLNGMSYVGQSINCKERWNYHKAPSTNVSPIDKAINEYGKENFSFQILLECPPDMLDVWEIDMINLHNTIYPNGYNYQGGGRNEYNDVCDETRRKISESLKNRPPISEETRRKQSESAKNRPPISEETIRKISESRKGKGTDPKTKCKWLTPSGEIREMSAHMVSHWHKDWVKIEE